MQVQRIAVEKIQPSPSNPRKDFDKGYLVELGASLLQNGQQEPVKVRPVNGHFELVFGECRLRAAKLVGLKELDAIVEQLDDKTADVLRLVENVKRKDLSVFEEAEHLKLLHEKHKVKVDDLAKQVGISVRGIFEALRLAVVEPGVRKLVLEGKLAVSNAKLIARLRKDDQVKVAKEAAGDEWDGPMTHEKLEEKIRDEYMVDLRGAPFDLKAETLPCAAKSCAVCPKRSGNAKDEYPDLKSADICTSPADYRKKVEAFAKQAAKEGGAEVLDAKESERALSHGSSYVQLSAETWAGDTRKTIKEILPKKAEVKKVFAKDDEGNLIEVALRSEVSKALKDAGKEKLANDYAVTGRHSNPSGGSNLANVEQKKRRRALELRRAGAIIAIEKMANHKAAGDGSDAFIQALVVAFAPAEYGENFRHLVKQLQPDGKVRSGSGVELGGAFIRKHAAGLKGVELRRFAVRVAFAGAMDGGGTWSDSHSRDLQLGAKVLGVDLEKCDAEAKAAAQAKEKPAPKAKAKKGGAR